MVADVGTAADGALHVAAIGATPEAEALEDGRGHACGSSPASSLSSSGGGGGADGIIKADDEDEEAAPAPAAALRFFTRGCARSLTVTLLLYSGALALGALLAHGQRHLGLILLSLLPAAFTMGYMQQLFPKCTLRSEMLLTFFWALVCMAPLVVLENLAYAAVLTQSTLEAQGGRHHSTAARTWGYKLLADLVRAYLLAAFFEELSKYVALRRLRRARHVTDPRALAAYGLCAGAAFGTVEDLFIYAFAYGVDNTVARAFLSVPLHCMTGLLMGLSLAEDRFRHHPTGPGSQQGWARVLLAPVLLHGTYDAVNFLLDDVCGEAALAAEVLIVLGGFAWARLRLLALLRLHPVEHDLVGLLRRAARGDKLAVAEARALQEDEDDHGAGAALGLGPLAARVLSCCNRERGATSAAAAASAPGPGGGRARAGSNDGYATDLDLSSSTAASTVAGEGEAEGGGEAAVAGADAADALEAGAAAAGPAAATGKGEPRVVVVVGPSGKAIAVVGLVGCSLTAGMLCFLYLVPWL